MTSRPEDSTYGEKNEDDLLPPNTAKKRSAKELNDGDDINEKQRKIKKSRIETSHIQLTQTLPKKIVQLELRIRMLDEEQIKLQTQLTIQRLDQNKQQQLLMRIQNLEIRIPQAVNPKEKKQLLTRLEQLQDKLEKLEAVDAKTITENLDHIPNKINDLQKRQHELRQKKQQLQQLLAQPGYYNQGIFNNTPPNDPIVQQDENPRLLAQSNSNQ